MLNLPYDKVVSEFNSFPRGIADKDNGQNV